MTTSYVPPAGNARNSRSLGDGGDERPDYSRQGVPLLSFLFALHCDEKFSRKEYERWLKDWEYDGYLKVYLRDMKRPFPALAIPLIKDVPKANIKDSNGRYLPAKECAQEMSQMLAAELAYTATPSGNSAPKDAAFRYPGRPLLSCLAMVYLNEDKAFWSSTDSFLADFKFDPAVQTIFKSLAKMDKPATMVVNDAAKLVPYLTKEFCAPPACW
jgi:hypothetical protein